MAMDGREVADRVRYNEVEFGMCDFESEVRVTHVIRKRFGILGIVGLHVCSDIEDQVPSVVRNFSVIFVLTRALYS